MSEFKELIKSFGKSREYVRDFFVYGFKTREDFTLKSSRTYDNERRRIESWLSDYIKKDYTEKGQNISLAMDSNLLDTNPLYNVWKSKSFTDNDIMLHFFLLDCLGKRTGATADELADIILTSYDVLFDPQMIRRKCNEYVDEGLFYKQKRGREIEYHKSPSFGQTVSEYPALMDLLKLGQLCAPIGILGNTILENQEEVNRIFRVKHNFFVHTLEDEILLPLLTSMREHKRISMVARNNKNHKEQHIDGIPLQILCSTKSGRRFLCFYSEKNQRFSTLRLDFIKEVKLLSITEDFEQLRSRLKDNHPHLWGVSFQNYERHHLQRIALTLHIDETKEPYVLSRLEREGKHGTITKVAPCTYLYEHEVFDVGEMLPWIRTFTGRIQAIESDSKRLLAQFQNDMDAMYKLYEITNEKEV